MLALPQTACAEGARPRWSSYVAVDDVDASASQAKKDGGNIHRAPDDIPGVGRFATISDPQGATLALFKPSASAEAKGQPAAPGTPGHGGWHELRVPLILVESLGILEIGCQLRHASRSSRRLD